MSVPRYLHEHWKNTATPNEKDQLQIEKEQMRKQIVTTSEQRDREYEVKKEQIKAKRAKRDKL